MHRSRVLAHTHKIDAIKSPIRGNIPKAEMLLSRLLRNNLNARMCLVNFHEILGLVPQKYPQRIRELTQ